MTITFTAHRGSANTKTPATTLAMSPSAAVPADALLVIRVVTDNQVASAGSDAGITCSDDLGNTYTLAEQWTQSGGSVNDGATTAILYSVVATQIETSDEITFTGANVAAKAIGADQFSVGSTDIQVGDNNGAAATSSDISVGTGTITSQEYLFVVNTAYEYATGSFDSEDADYTTLTTFGTSGGGPTGNVQSWGAYRIATTTSDQYDAVLSGARDFATAIVAFNEGGTPPVSINAGVGSHVYTGIAATVTPGAASVTAAVASNVYTGIAATITPVTSIQAAVASNVYTGIAGSVTPGAASITAAVGQQTYTGIAATVTPGAITVTAAVGSNVFTGVAGSADITTRINAGVGQITYTGIAASVTPGAITVTAAVASNVYTGVAGSVSLATIINAGVGQITHTGIAGSVTPGAASVTAAVGQITYTGIAASVTPGAISVTGGVGSNVLTGVAGSVTPGAVTVTGSVASNVYTGIQASIDAGGAVVITAGVGQITWTGVTAVIFIATILGTASGADAEVYTATGGDASNYNAAGADAGVYTATASDRS
jgi:hypothetical protein